jgi:hypothetical protein
MVTTVVKKRQCNMACSFSKAYKPKGMAVLLRSPQPSINTSFTIGPFLYFLCSLNKTENSENSYVITTSSWLYCAVSELRSKIRFSEGLP